MLFLLVHVDRNDLHQLLQSYFLVIFLQEESVVTGTVVYDYVF